MKGRDEQWSGAAGQDELDGRKPSDLEVQAVAPFSPQSLLQQYSMRNAVCVGDFQVILSVEPRLQLGDVAGIDSDYSNKSGVAIFAEGINLIKDFKAKVANIATSTLTIAKGAYYIV